MTVGDFDRDGDQDIATVSGGVTSNIILLLGNGAGGFTFSPKYPVSIPDSASITSGDFNGDGILDLATTGWNGNFNQNKVGVLLGNGDGTFGTVTYFATGGANPTQVRVGDLNKDTFLDLVIANRDSTDVGVLLGDGTGIFGTAQQINAGGGTASLELADLDGDEKVDIVSGKVLLNTTTVGSSTVSFASPTLFPTGGSLALGDVNGDNRPDIASTDFNPGTVKITLNNGDGTFGTATPFSSPVFAANVKLVDLNGDGNLDIASHDDFRKVVTIMAGNGLGGFASPQIFGRGDGNAQALALVISTGTTNQISSPASTNLESGAK